MVTLVLRMGESRLARDAPWLGSVIVNGPETDGTPPEDDANELGYAVSNDPLSAEKPVTILPESECWQLLSRVPLGRLVTSADGHPEIFPVNFVVQDRTILFRTAEGTKLVTSAINNNVVFEADDHDATEGWSVIVKGVARSVHTDDDIDKAERAQLLPWTATVKDHYVRVLPRQVTGRRFRFGPEPGREFTVV